jgi:hypothetical protein
MTNLTITIDDQTLERARIKASNEGTSVDALVREYLESYAGSPRITAGSREEQIEAIERLIALSKKGDAGSGPDGRTWKREDLYDRSIGQGRYG